MRACPVHLQRLEDRVEQMHSVVATMRARNTALAAAFSASQEELVGTDGARVIFDCVWVARAMLCCMKSGLALGRAWFGPGVTVGGCCCHHDDGVCTVFRRMT